MFKKRPGKTEKIIVKVRVSKIGQKLITVPKNTPIQGGDYVILTKLEENQ